MKIEWNKVTWYSKLIAIVVYVGTFALAFWFGRMYEAAHPAYSFTPEGYLIPEGPAAE
ncbi:MAG TPA: hypothetical protein VHC20_02045 [Candidatus Paceibacterota bacterium]|nr:hypothetical protein [Candidatus Paceibacterota bacterium]